MAWGLPDWLTGSSSSSPAQPSTKQKASDGGYVAPDRNKREVCYESRDIFFECLDRHDILDAVKHDEEARRNCGPELKDFERDCARSWVGPTKPKPRQRKSSLLAQKKRFIPQTRWL